MNSTARIAATFDRSGTARDNVVAVAMPAVSRGAEGSGAPSGRVSPRIRNMLAPLAVAISFIALFAIPSSASAAPIGAKMESISEVSYGSAHVTGKVSAPGEVFGSKPTYSFEYSTDQITWTPGPGGIIDKDSIANKPVEGKLEGLKGGTTYFVRLRATTAFGVETVVSPGSPPYPELTTLVADPPSVEQADSASEVAYTTAKVTGKVNRPVKSDDLQCHFQYVTNEQFTSNPSGNKFAGGGEVPCKPNNPVSTQGSSTVEAHLGGLLNATTYHVRLVVLNASAEVTKEAPTFKTLTVDPPSVISTDNATEVEYTQVKVKGVVEKPANADLAFDVTCNFEYVTDEQFTTNPPGKEFENATQVPCEGESPIHANGQATVEAKLTALSPSTKYHLRLSASNQGGFDAREAAAAFTTLGPVPKPTVLATDDATGVTVHEATLKGEVQRPAGKDPAFDVNCHFEYVTDEQFTANPPGEEFAGAARTDCVENPITSDTADGEGKRKVSAQVGGLKAGAIYHLRLAAENMGGTVTKEAAHTFTTIEAEKPVVTIDPVAGGTYTTAYVTGTVEADDPAHATNGNPEHDCCILYVAVDISSDGGKTWTQSDTGRSQFTANPNLWIVEAAFTGLQPGTTYTFRTKGKYAGGYGVGPESEALGEVAFSPGPNPSITTEPATPPTVEGFAVTGVGATTAHFSATVDPQAPAGPLSDLGKKAFATKWEFVCTPECNDPLGNVLGGTIQGEEGPQPIAVDAEGLEPNTHYDVSVVVHNQIGDDTETKPFNTPLIKPTVKSLPGGSDGNGGYILAGVVTPNKSLVTDCKFEWGPIAPQYAFSAACSPMPGGGLKPVTVEAPLTGLNPGVVYHANLVATNAAGTEDSKDFTFVATLAPKEGCTNEKLREENSSLALPECRAYERVTPSGKEGFPAEINDTGPDAVLFSSFAGNLAGSGNAGSLAASLYVATRTATGWETMPNLNGPSGSMLTSPSGARPRYNYPHFSADFRSSLWLFPRVGQPEDREVWIRKSDGSLVSVGKGCVTCPGVLRFDTFAGASDDLSHIVYTSERGEIWGPGVHEFVGTGDGEPRRVDLDNSGGPISTCRTAAVPFIAPYVANAGGTHAVSSDGRVIFVTATGSLGHTCSGTAIPPADEVWARIGGAVSVRASASHCDRAPASPGGACNAPADAAFQGASSDGSRVFISTTQQLLNADTDQTNDLYECDVPSGTPAPIGKGNPCDAFREVSGAATGADVEKVFSLSEDGSTVYFIAKGVLASNEDGLGNTALAGGRNLYVWRTTAAHPDGQTSFVARLTDSGLGISNEGPQSTPDGRYLLFLTRTPLLLTDTDEAADLYRYDAETGLLTRTSTRLAGVGGNGNFEVQISFAADPAEGGSPHHPNSAISDDGQKVVFSTPEPLAAVDGNDAKDVYLWTPTGVSLITTGSVGGGEPDVDAYTLKLSGTATISSSGRDIFFGTPGRLVAADGDQSTDVYDARVNGGFTNPPPDCSGEACQSPAPTPPSVKGPGSGQPSSGNPTQPKTCPKGKVKKRGKCVKQPSKKHSGKKHHPKKHKRANSNSGGGK